MGISVPTLAQINIPKKNFLLACYAVSLTSNETIFYCIIKASTVNLYLSDAAKLAIFKNLPDPTKNSLNQKSSYITNVVNEHRRWETMPNRREPLTFLMVERLFSLSYGCTSTAVNDSLEAALTDWFIIGMHTGTRKSEWCQDRYILQKNGNVIKNRDGSSSAFVLDDFMFEHPVGFRCNTTRAVFIYTLLLFSKYAGGSKKMEIMGRSFPT